MTLHDVCTRHDGFTCCNEQGGIVGWMHAAQVLNALPSWSGLACHVQGEVKPRTQSSKDGGLQSCQNLTWAPSMPVDVQFYHMHALSDGQHHMCQQHAIVHPSNITWVEPCMLSAHQGRIAACAMGLQQHCDSDRVHTQCVARMLAEIMPWHVAICSG